MNLLLDSHILMWFDNGDRRLRAPMADQIRSNSGRVVVSAATIWELPIKRSIGRLPGSGSFLELAVRNNFELLPVTPLHAERVASLPHLHGDPFDRMLVAQAMVEGLTLVTHDATLEQYAVPLLRV